MDSSLLFPPSVLSRHLSGKECRSIFSPPFSFPLTRRLFFQVGEQNKEGKGRYVSAIWEGKGNESSPGMSHTRSSREIGRLLQGKKRKTFLFFFFRVSLHDIPDSKIRERRCSRANEILCTYFLLCKLRSSVHFLESFLMEIARGVSKFMHTSPEDRNPNVKRKWEGHKRRETSPYFNLPHKLLGREKNEHPEKSIQEENGRYFVYPSHHTKNFLRDKQNLGIFHKYNIGEEERPSFSTSALLPVLSRAPLYASSNSGDKIPLPSSSLWGGVK